MTLDFVTENSNGENVGSRTYLMSSATEYEIFDLLGKEFTFDVDVSKLPCGLNGALYFVSMPADGGLSSTNKAGAAYGTGYCDSQCPRDLKFIDGEANIEGWVSSTNNANTGVGDHGSCCPEMVCSKDPRLLEYVFLLTFCIYRTFGRPTQSQPLSQHTHANLTPWSCATVMPVEEPTAVTPTATAEHATQMDVTSTATARATPPSTARA